MQHSPEQDLRVRAAILAVTTSQWWPDGRVVLGRRSGNSRRAPQAGSAAVRPVHRTPALPSVVDFALARRRHVPLSWAV